MLCPVLLIELVNNELCNNYFYYSLLLLLFIIYIYIISLGTGWS